ncbi:PQQ-binding-like beta-propeller repeat protein [Paenibacillus tuaregi]|uniref:PQQ-binding-like beta-propeller repeat protein n=1 Tax=Paenibacillus tuaregi TaxID=1816681 RepID=UPI000838BA86|nr:PQQ-binding-like beta-propeller repeat protein [Paenibacillus tuaregi]
MDWLNKGIAERWRAEGIRYASDINEYVRVGNETGWPENLKPPEEDQRRSIAGDILQMIREANRCGETKKLREEIPPASWPITSEFPDKLQPVKPLAFLQDGSLLVHAGSGSPGGTLYRAHAGDLTEITGANYAGSSRDGAYVALVNEQGIRVVKGMTGDTEGEQVAVFRWKDVQGRLKAALPDLESLADGEHPERHMDEVIPVDGGRRVMLVCGYGIYLLGGGEGEVEVELLHPELADLREYESEDTIVDMAHGDISPDGRWLAYGSQSSEHQLKDLQSGAVYAYEPASSYPHFARFSEDSREVWFNACHFYNGATFKVPLAEAAQKREWGSPEEWLLTNEEMRVYAGVSLQEGYILGDAYGYLRFIDRKGQEIWRYFVGSTISGMTLTVDEKVLAVGTYGGMLHLLDLKCGQKSEYSIGTAAILETDRWMLWQNQEPLSW